MARRHGFTLIEVVVVIGVMAFIMSTVLANFPLFKQEVSVSNEAQHLVLYLRKAQSFALGVREFNPAFNNDPFCENPPVRFPGYGIYLITSDTHTFTLFGDADCSKTYTTGVIDETVESVGLSNNVTISGITAYNLTSCSSGCPVTELSILYLRPSPTTFIRGDGIYYDSVNIKITSGDNRVSKTILVASTGQISIQ